MDFREVLGDCGIEPCTEGPKCRQGWINFFCPFCQRDPYMGFNISTGHTHCWNCGYHSLYDVLVELTGLPKNKCYELMKGIARNEELPVYKKKGVLKIPPGLGPLLPVHRDYIRSRGFLPSKMVSLWEPQGIGVAGGNLKWRIWLPVHYRGEIVSWTTRAVGENVKLRYLSASAEESAIPIEDLLYGIDYVCNSVVLVEGPMDVWKIGPGAAALLGMRVSPAQLEQLSRIPNRTICFDREPEAQRRALKLADDLAVLPGTTRRVILDAKDAGSADRGEVELLRKEFLT